MASRRAFFRGLVGAGVSLTLVPTGEGAVRETARDIPEETVQDLIDQIRFLEREPGHRDHIRAIEDKIRVRLFLNDMACLYRDDRGRLHLCLLRAETGELLTMPLRSATTRFDVEATGELERVGFGGLDLGKVPMAYRI